MAAVAVCLIQWCFLNPSSDLDLGTIVLGSFLK